MHDFVGIFLRVLLSLAILTVLETRAYASELEWNGFFSTGASFTDSKVPYQTTLTRRLRLTDDTLFGLNIGKSLSPDWRVAAQILSRAGQADSAAKIDWAFVTYKSKYAFDFTLGKQKIPMWMISSFRDVGRAYPWVIPPEEIYSIFALRSFTGASFDYILTLGASTLTFNPYGGDVLLETAPNAPTAFSKVKGTNMMGIAIEWVWDKIQVRAGYNKALWNVSASEQIQYGERRYQIASVGVKVDVQNFLLLAEYGATTDFSESNYLKRADELIEQATESAATGDAATAKKLEGQAAVFKRKLGGSDAYYVTVGRQIGSFLPHLTYAELDRPYETFSSRDQKAVTLGINYDISTDSVVKLEAKRIYLPEDGQGLFSAPTDAREAMVYRTGYSMIF